MSTATPLVNGKAKSGHRKRGHQSVPQALNTVREACRHYSTTFGVYGEISESDLYRLLDTVETCRQMAWTADSGDSEVPPEQRVNLRFHVSKQNGVLPGDPTVIVTSISFPCDLERFLEGESPVTAVAKSLRKKSEALLHLSRQLEGEVRA